MNVIQGYFVGRPSAQPVVTTRTHPPTYQELSLQAHQRSSGLAVQSFGNKNAFVVPPHLAGFGRRTGQKLPPAVQQKMESLFAADFSDVYVHSGPEAGAIGALAFTQGSHIYFAPGQYNPHSHFGRQLLAHELTHVVQQRAGRVRNPFGSVTAVVQDPQLEAEAERMGRQAAMHHEWAEARSGRRAVSPALPLSIQRTARPRVVQRAGGTGPAPAPAPVVYTLTAAQVGNTVLGACGNFKYERRFTVNPAPTTASIIVQKITRSFVSLEQYTPKDVPPYGLDLELKTVAPDTVNRNALAGWRQYWEVFTVAANSTEAVPTDDFALTCMAKSTKKSKKLVNAIVAAKRVTRSVASAVYSYRTKGSFTQTGEAVFYENSGVPGGFAVNRRGPAGELPCATVDPSAGLAALNHSATLTFTLTAVWDSSTVTNGHYGEPTVT